MNPQRDLFENHAEATLAQALGPAFEIIFTANRRIMVSVDKRTVPAKARVSNIFTMADRETILQLGRFISRGGGGPLPPIVKHYIHEKAPRQAGTGRKEPRPKTKGKIFDLSQIAAQIALKYFGGAIKTRLTWGRKTNQASKLGKSRSIRFGSYDRDLDMITIHPALDDIRVPRLFLEFVVYHEMLHKIIPPKSGADGRTRFHYGQFKAREREFEGYHQAMQWQKTGIWKILGKPAQGASPGGGMRAILDKMIHV